MKSFCLCLFFACCIIPSGLAQVEENLVAHFTFDEPVIKNRIFPNKEPQIYGSSPQAAPGVVGKAIYFDGIANELYFPNSLNYTMEGEWPFTLSFYFRSEDLSKERSLMGKRRRCDGERMFDIRVGRHISVELSHRRNGSRSCNVSAPIPDKQWHHYAYVRQPNAAFLFIDGKLADYQVIGRRILLEESSLFGINASPCKDVGQLGQLKGALDDLKLYNRALVPEEIWWLYRARRHEQRRANQAPVAAAPPAAAPPVAPANRLQQIFGNYKNAYPEVISELKLEPKRFILTIQQPRQYSEARELTFTGKYRIEAGQLYLLGNKLLLTRTDGSQQQQPYNGPQLIGSLYGQTSIDLNAFDERLKLDKN